jgi:O-antigen/teichoic acid export membrane protein
MQAVQASLTNMDLAAGSHKKRAFTNFFSLSLLQIGNYVLPMITLPIISRIIGPEKYGLINYAFAFSGYFILLINAGFDLYGTRLVVAHRDDREALNAVFSRIIIAKSVLMVFASVLFAACLFLIPQLRNEKLLAIFTFLVCIGWVINPSWLFHGMQDSKKYAVFSFLSKLIFAILVIVIVQQREDYIYHPLITSLAHILVSAFAFHYAARRYRLKMLLSNGSSVLQTLRENFQLSLIWWITNQAISTNIILAGFFLTTLDLGHYAAAIRIIIILQSIVAVPLNAVLFPYIGDAFNHGYEQGIARVHKTLPYLVLICSGMMLVTFACAKWIILGFYGKEFAEGIILLKVFSSVLFFSLVNSAFGQQILLNLKSDALYMKLVILGLALNILFIFLLAGKFAGVGAAWAWPASEAIIFIIYVAYFKMKKIRIVEFEYYKPSFLLQNISGMMKWRKMSRTNT